MILISHRGNLNRKQENWENDPSYILEALKEGYDVEIDVWHLEDYPDLFNDSIFFLGHDKPQYRVSIDFLMQDRLWIHCKNIEALYKLYDKTHCFFIDRDDVVLGVECEVAGCIHDEILTIHCQGGVV